MRKRKEARPFRPRLLLSNVQHLVVAIAVAKGTHRSRSDPALVGARKIWAKSDQKEGVCAGSRSGIECPGEIRIHFHDNASAPKRARECGFLRDIQYHSGYLHKPPLSDPIWPRSSGRQPALDRSEERR